MIRSQLRRDPHDGTLFADRTPRRGSPYTHGCCVLDFDMVVRHVLEVGETFTGTTVAQALDRPVTAVYVAIEFLQTYGFIETVHGRQLVLVEGTEWEDVMVPFHALLEGVTGFEEDDAALARLCTSPLPQPYQIDLVCAVSKGGGIGELASEFDDALRAAGVKIQPGSYAITITRSTS